MIKAILFDLDGTVLASQEGIFRSVAYALDHLGLPMPDEKRLLAFLGPPLGEGFRNVCGVPEGQIADAIRLYREYYNGGGMFEAYIYDGMLDCMQALHELSVKTFITTSKPRVYAEKILEYFSANRDFDGIYGCELDGTRSHKSEVVRFCLEEQGIDSSEALLVGDRHFDVAGARECNMDCVGVTFGYGGTEELEQAGARYIAHTAIELTDLLKTLIKSI